MREKITTRMVNGCRLNVIENRGINNVMVEICYMLPINMETRFVGVPHLFEHMAFNDIIPSAKNSTEIMSMANNVNVDLNARTGNNRIIFTANLKSYLLLDKNDPAYDSIKRFDYSSEGMKFLKKYIEGVVAEHVFLEKDLEAEKGIILGEREGASSMIDLIDDKLSRAVSGVDVLGSKQDILEFDIDTLNEFSDLLPKPSITIKYNPDIDVFSDIEYFCERALDKVKNKNGKIPTANIDRIPSISESIYDGTLDIRFFDDGESVLNGVAITYPDMNKLTAEDLERSIIKKVAAEMLVDSFLEGSIANTLREKKNLTYTVYTAGIIAGDNKVGTKAFFSHINEKYDFGDRNSLKEFCHLLDTTIKNMRTPTETEFITALTTSMVSVANNISVNSAGASIAGVANMLNTGYSITAIECLRTLPYKFSYHKFKEIYEELVEFLTFVIL